MLLFVKLFAIMGLTWISECIHIVVHGDHARSDYCNFYVEASAVIKKTDVPFKPRWKPSTGPVAGAT